MNKFEDTFFNSPHVQELMLREQEQVQGKRDLEVFMQNPNADSNHGGFNWDKSNTIHVTFDIMQSVGSEPVLKDKVTEYPSEYKGLKFVEDLGIHAKYLDPETGEIYLVHNMEIFKEEFYS